MSMPVLTQSRASRLSREASFSSYLDGAENGFVLESRPATARAFTPSIATPHPRIPFAQNGADDREIDVFAAEKYFNDGLNFSPSKSVSTRKHKEDDLAISKQQQPPIVALNSRSNSSLTNANKKSLLASIGCCNCTCADKNSVNMDGFTAGNCSVNQSNGQPEVRVTAVGRFNFPFLSSRSANPTAKQEKIGTSKKRSRVFGSPITNGKNKLPMATWDAVAPSQVENLKIPSIFSERHNDSSSDASSDLFEIESLYKDNPCMTPTTCYAPSEASIEWSVVTASAADFSILSDSEEVTSSISTSCLKRPGVSSKTVPFKEMPRIRPSFLSGCKSHKAVSIAGDHMRGGTRHR